MNPQDLHFIRACLPQGRTKFYTFKDHYLFKLLTWRIGSQTLSVRELKQCPQLARYAQNPRFRDFLSTLPDGQINATRLTHYWPALEDTFNFRLTLDEWGNDEAEDDDWNQTSRRGPSLVLQLNFPASHDRAYRQLHKEEKDPFYFGCTGHPVRNDKVTTMAWARIDLDLERGTALIEEIQNDWLRDALCQRQRIERRLKHGELTLDDSYYGVNVRRYLAYYDKHLAPLHKIWAEATLLAALSFLRDELGLRSVYYHTWESGIWFKKISKTWAPPRSIYTKLPQRLGFAYINRGPEFILHDHVIQRRLKKAHKQTKRKKTPSNHHWWHLDLKQERPIQ